MRYCQPGTRDFYESAPQLRKYDVRHLRLPATAMQTRAFRQNHSANVVPEREALDFYVLNHLVAVVRKRFDKFETLPQWANDVYQAYGEVLANQGARMFHYMLLITTRESRHTGGSGWKVGVPSPIAVFQSELKSKGSEGAANHVMTAPVDTSLGEYTAAMVHMFLKGNFSGGFGGKPWANITDTLRKFVFGEISLEMMLDTAYTLAHNNGPMFNKGMLYAMYNGPLIYRILDVQRSGQVPELMIAEKLNGQTVTVSWLKKIIEAGGLESEFGSFVDWIKVEKLGSLHKYPKEIEAQKKISPESMPAGYKHAGTLQILPGAQVTLMQRIKKAA